MPAQLNKKNGKIELYRFIFCLFVLFFHFNKYFFSLPETWGKPIDLALFPHGAVAVEFFFLVSGWLMAKSIYKRRVSSLTNADRFIPADGLNYIKHKFLSMMPQRIPAFIFAFVSYALLHDLNAHDTFLSGIYSIPSFFLLQMSGWKLTVPNHLEWYLSAMLIVMSVLYPICIRFYESFTRYFAPLLSILLVGYMMYTTKSLSGVTVWTGLCFKSVLRAVVDISLGTSAFELSRYLAEKQFSKGQELFATVLELICFSGVTVFSLFTFGLDLEPMALIALFVLVSIAFSGVSVGSKLFNNRFCYMLGKFSLPIYISQITAINLTNTYFKDNSGIIKIVVALGLTLAVSAAVYSIGILISRMMRHYRRV